MKVLITGASGMVGTRLVEALLLRGDEVAVTSRDPAAHVWPAGVTAQKWQGSIDAGGVDAIVNLAGANIGQRWTRGYPETIRESRMNVTQAVAKAAAGKRVISASAVGYYGQNPSGPCPEERPPGDDFLAQLCQDWEAAAGDATIFRFGHVMDTRGGVLGRVKPIYKARMGGPLGNGQQPLPWIHHADLTGALLWALDGHASGTYNLVAPHVPEYKLFHAALQEHWGRQIGLPVPKAALRLAVGGLAPYLCGGQEAVPARLQSEGFHFKHPQLREALASIL